MALTGDQIEAISRSSVDLYREAEQAIVAEVTRRLAAGQDAPDWAVTRLGAVSALRRSVGRILGLVAAAGVDRIRAALARAYRTGRATATIGLPAQLLPGDPDLVGAAAAALVVPRVAAMESLAAALVADVGAKHSNVLRHVEDVYRTVIQRATAVSVAGGMTRRQASQHAYQRFVDQGVTGFTDAAGRHWRLSSYVEMAVRTVTQRTAVQGQTDRLLTLGVDLVIVSDSPRECPLCRPWEGKVLRIGAGPVGQIEVPSAVSAGTVTVDVAGTVDGARAQGLMHPNCTHSLRAYLPGATRLPTGDLANPGGYQAKQRQREIERQIRRWKERDLAALDPAAKTAARAKTREWQAAMRDHLAEHPELKRLPYREQIGAGNLPSRPAGRAGQPISAEDLGLPPTPAVPPQPQPTQPAPALADRVKAGVTDRQILSGGQNAVTELVTLADGSQAVHKTAKAIEGVSARTQQDAEELASLVLRSLGIRAPETYRAGTRDIYLEHLDGQLAAELPREGATFRIAGGHYDTDDGRILGLADLLMQNYDRNAGNWLITAAGLQAIDHGFAFIALNDPTATMISGDSNYFVEHYHRPYPRSGEWADNDLSPEDIATARARLQALRPEFGRLGQLDWHDKMMARLDTVGRHATGTRSRLR